MANKVCLVAIDGWGIAPPAPGNAITNASTPNMNLLATKYLATNINASGLHVGLPDGVMGNSEVGHLTMGAGRVDFQDLVKINKCIAEGNFASTPGLVEAIGRAKAGNGRLHFLGLVSDGAVHSHIAHLREFLSAAKAADVPKSFVHFFADGRDTPPTSAGLYIKQLQTFLAESNYGSIATVIGRYYAMDRDKRWDRIEIAYNALLGGDGEEVGPDGLLALVEKRAAAGENDEFLKPIINDKDGIIQDGDTLIFINFRADRMREIVQAIGVKAPFHPRYSRSNTQVFQMTQYNAAFPLPVLFPPVSMENVLAEWVSKHKLKQFHIAETEKYAHVTFFFNGGREDPFEGETRQLVPSPKVPTYDLEPKMSARGVADGLCAAMETGTYPFVMCNFAPPDMVGHTGVYEKTLIAVSETDQCIGQLLASCQANGYTMVVTADHGNAEMMLEDDGSVRTAHTTNLIPLYVAPTPGLVLEWGRSEGGLCDVAPTVLDIMGLPKPPQMTGSSMLKSRELVTTSAKL